MTASEIFLDFASLPIFFFDDPRKPTMSAKSPVPLEPLASPMFTPVSCSLRILPYPPQRPRPVVVSWYAVSSLKSRMGHSHLVPIDHTSNALSAGVSKLLGRCVLFDSFPKLTFLTLVLPKRFSDAEIVMADSDAVSLLVSHSPIFEYDAVSPACISAKVYFFVSVGVKESVAIDGE